LTDSRRSRVETPRVGFWCLLGISAACLPASEFHASRRYERQSLFPPFLVPSVDPSAFAGLTVEDRLLSYTYSCCELAAILSQYNFVTRIMSVCWGVRDVTNTDQTVVSNETTLAYFCRYVFIRSSLLSRVNI